MSSQGADGNEATVLRLAGMSFADNMAQQHLARNATGKDHVTTLPNELLTDIDERLPGRNICHLRAQNRRLRRFVDSSQIRLATNIIRHHRARITRDYH